MEFTKNKNSKARKEQPDSETENKWQEYALAFMREKGPDEDGNLGFIIRPHHATFGNAWIDWLYANKFKEPARALASMVKARGGYMVPCQNPLEFSRWLEGSGIEVHKPVRLPKPAKQLPPAQERNRLDPSLIRKANHSPEAQANAAEMIRRSPTGELARVEGWLNALFEFVRDTGQFPNVEQEHALKVMVQRNDAVMAEPGNRELAEALRERRQAIENKIFHQDSPTWSDFSDAAE